MFILLILNLKVSNDIDFPVLTWGKFHSTKDGTGAEKWQCKTKKMALVPKNGNVRQRRWHWSRKMAMLDKEDGTRAGKWQC